MMDRVWFAGRRLEVAILTAVAALPFVVFWPLTVGAQVWYVLDVHQYFYPYHLVSANLLRSGQLPLWNPYTFGGLPLLGDGQTAMFYPPNWLFFVLPGFLALNWAILLQFSIAGAGMYLCARSFGAGPLAALLAGLAYMFCGMLTGRVVHLSIMSGAALVPWVLLTVEQALRVGEWSRRWFAAAALAVGMQALAGHPQIPVYTAAAMGLLALLRVLESVLLGRAAQGWVPLVRLVGIYVLGYALAAVQLVPWVELGLASPRAAGATFQFVFGTSARFADWLQLLFPFGLGAQRTGIFASAPQPINLAVRAWEQAAYVGMLPLALAIVGAGLIGRRTRATPAVLRFRIRLVFLVLMALVGVLIAAGDSTPAAELIYRIPVLGKLRAVERAKVLLDAALVVLAAVGFESLLRARGRVRALPLVLAGVLVLLAGAALGAARQGWLALVLPALTLERANFWLPVLLMLGSALALVLLAFGRRGGAVLAVALVAFDMGVYAAAYNPTTTPDFYTRTPESLAFLPRDGTPFRKATILLNNTAFPSPDGQEALVVSWGMAYGVEDINGFNSLQPRRYTDLVFGPQEGDVSYGYLPNQALLQPESPIFPALNVRYVLVPVRAVQPTLGAHLRLVAENAWVRVYENTAVWPWAFFPASARTERDPAQVLATVTAPGFDGRRTALVEGELPPLGPPAASDSVELLERQANRISVRTSTSSARLLLTSEMYFAGWRATIDGATASILRTNYLFRGVVVPAGEHRVVFVYAPVSAQVGVAVSLLAAALLGWLVSGRRAGGIRETGDQE